MEDLHLQSDLFAGTDEKQQNETDGNEDLSCVSGLVEPLFGENAQKVLKKRYLKRSVTGEILEKPGDMLLRVAEAVASAEENFEGDVQQTTVTFYNLMAKKEFLPNSPTLMNAGRELGQLSACFVLPVDDSMESIFTAVKNTALIHKSGGGTGFSFSRIRPENDAVMSTKGVSSGPISFMTVFDQATETVKQGGVRRGANMAVLRVDHPDIEEFINVKRNMEKLNNFNLSVAATDDFMDAVERGTTYNLVNPRNGTVVDSKDANEVFNRIVDSAWNSGEPGLIFIDRMNDANPTPHVGRIEATNPCGEQPLLPYEACNLGSVNVSVMAEKHESGTFSMNWTRLERTVRTAVRFLDDVIEINRYPLPEIAEMVAGNRKIGLGVMGFADLLFKLSIPYDSEEALLFAEELMSFIAEKGRKASMDLAKERGPFPNFSGSVYDNKNMPPMRNATVTTIAPTGSISILAGCSGGIEPVFALAFTRRNLLDQGDELHEVVPEFGRVARERNFFSEEVFSRVAEKGSCQDIPEIPRDVQRIFVTSHDISPAYHVRMQAAFQKYTDNAVSKTVNLPEKASRKSVSEVFKLSRRLGCKGITVYRDKSRDKQVLNLVKSKEAEKADEVALPSVPIGPRDRGDVTSGITRRIRTGCGKLYVTINMDEDGPVELFSQMGKAGGCAASQSEAISRLVSLALRSNIQPEAIVKELKGISCHRIVWQGGNRILSCADAIGQTIEWYIDEKMETPSVKSSEVIQSIEPVFSEEEPPIPPVLSDDEEVVENLAGACPMCGGPLKYESGCVACALSCGYSECG
ncbi:MAG: vitamin B12-dependent ribonucleotide reductase [Candidatus Fermentibacteraceae bacterium]|nr:vitamin B12-dependent ribonucleotide reductase [Candidatus Fermentibacteraceae bacterium]